MINAMLWICIINPTIQYKGHKKVNPVKVLVLNKSLFRQSTEARTLSGIRLYLLIGWVTL